MTNYMGFLVRNHSLWVLKSELKIVTTRLMSSTLLDINILAVTSKTFGELYYLSTFPYSLRAWSLFEADTLH